MIMPKHVTRMTLREKCAQRVFIDFRFDAPDYDRTMRLVKDEGVGGVCLFGGTIFDVTSLVNALQKVAKFPLLVAADYENGAGEHVRGATFFPSNMAIGATGSEELAHLKARHTGLEARALGVRWVLGPVVDVNSNPLNPVINTRSFGQDPAAVARLARATARGLRASGALSCAKHFPGHGAVSTDSHLSLPVVESSLERLHETELRPYVELGAEVDGVMTGHLLVRSLDPRVPASLSREVTEGLLRRQLHFEGLVCTDALVMGAIAKFCPEEEAAVRAAEAGADVLLYPADPGRAVTALVEAAQQGRLPEAGVDRAVERILHCKEKQGLFTDRITDPSGVEQVVGCAAHRAAAQRIADGAVTLARGEGRVEGSTAYLHVAEGETRTDLTVFREELARKVKIEEGAETCVVGLFFRPRAFVGKTGLDDSVVSRIREARKRHKRVVVVSFGSPYVIRDLPDMTDYVCTYGEDEFSQRAAAKALLREIPYKGVLPVRI